MAGSVYAALDEIECSSIAQSVQLMNKKAALSAAFL